MNLHKNISVCEQFLNQLNTGDVNFQLSVDDVNNDISNPKTEMSCLYYELVKYPAVRQNELIVKIPVIGQLFIGIESVKEIKCVHYIVKNYTEERKIKGCLINNIWSIFNIPFPICITEHEITALISFNSIPTSIDAIYGFLSHRLIVDMYKKLVYKFQTEIETEPEIEKKTRNILMISNILKF